MVSAGVVGEAGIVRVEQRRHLVPFRPRVSHESVTSRHQPAGGLAAAGGPQYRLAASTNTQTERNKRQDAA